MWRSGMSRPALLPVGGRWLLRASALVPLLAVLMLGGWLPAGAAEEESATELAKKTQNPVADLNYNIADGWYVTTGPIIPADWKAGGGQRWTVPVGGGVGKLFKLGKLPINTSLQGYYNVERPRFAADWQLRVQVQFLLPSF